MSTEKQYHGLAKDVYEVDSSKTKTPYRKGDLVCNDQYKILKVEDNQSNGMQAMAVAPIVDGKFVF